MLTRHFWKEWTALILLALVIGAGPFTGPSWKDSYTDICQWSNVLAVLTVALIWVSRTRGIQGVKMERLLSAAFLFGMPVIYMIRWLQADGGGAPMFWIWVEFAGLALYGLLTYWGLKTSPWYLAVGIAGHGFAWDSWHLAQHSSYIPDWYSLGCLSADIVFGAYVATRIPAWNRLLPRT